MSSRPSLRMIDDWPVDNAAAVVVTTRGGLTGVVETVGDTSRVFRLASLSKCMTAWATLVAVEEGTVELDTVVTVDGTPEGATLRHLLSHSAGLPFDGPRALAPLAKRRIYSNTGIELASTAVAAAADMPFDRYLAEAVFEPLGMSTSELRGSAAHAVWSTAADVAAFLGEMVAPRLLAPATATEATSIQYPDLAGIVPGVGSFKPCPWGLGVEIKGDKAPHWTGRTNSRATFGHFGGSGTMMWVDPVAGVGLAALTDRPFDEWSRDAMRMWPELSDAVLSQHRCTP